MPNLTASPVAVYRRQVVGQPITQRLYGEVRSAVYSAVIDLNEQRARPIGIWQDDVQVWEQRHLVRLWQACQADLAAHPFRLPRALVEAVGA